MTIHIDLAAQPVRVVLSGNSGVNDVELLLNTLQHHPGLIVELRDLRHMHAAVFQLLFKFGPAIAAQTDDPFIRDHVLPLLLSAQTSTEAKGSV